MAQTTFRPLLAAEVELDKLDKLQFPLLMSPKYDGIRAIVLLNGCVVSRSLKPIPSWFVQQNWGSSSLAGLDGELILGSPTAKDCYNKTFSAVMTHGSTVPVDFYVFDLVDSSLAYEARLKVLKGMCRVHASETVVTQTLASCWAEVEQYEKECLEAGYEGIMLRSPSAPYKNNRSTFLQQYLLKLKRFRDDEAVVEGAEELLHNLNEATTDARGYTVRTSHKENLVAGDTLGALLVRDAKTGIDFKIGSGMDTATRKSLWEMHKQGRLKGLLVTYKHLPYGAIDRPRQPVFKGFRSPIDM